MRSLHHSTHTRKARLVVEPREPADDFHVDSVSVHIADRKREDLRLKTDAIIARELPRAVAAVERLLVVLDRRETA